ncbi:MAG: aminomethyl transferase family protein [SAR202 cluster bacterium]|nr:aminomethyl transferase family protein [SAR202 cluster bacterium]
MRATGPDVLDLLNRLSTSLVDPLEVGGLARTVLTTNKGRVLDLLTVLRLADHVLIMTSEGAFDKVLGWLDKYTIAEDATYADSSTETAQLTIVGPKASEVVGAALGSGAGSLEPGQCSTLSWQGSNVIVARADPLGGPACDLVCPAAVRVGLAAGILAAGRSHGVVAAERETWETLRVQAGVPAYGHELTEAYNPLEAGLDSAISWTKGCYIGQEVVARLRTYFKVQRYLVRLQFGPSEEVSAGSRLAVDGAEAGIVTTAVPTPDGKGYLALGYLRTAFVKEGAGLRVEAIGHGGRRATGSVTWAPRLSAEAVTPAQLLELAAAREE